MIYTPREDSLLLEKYVEKYARGKKVIDIGTGSGIQAETAIKNGAKEVIASDIDKEAVENCRKKGIDALESDLFEKIKGKFDLIIFNPPYLPEDLREDEESKTVTTGGKKGDEILLRFIEQSAEHINNDGKILIIVSSITPTKRIVRLMKKLKMKRRVLETEKMFMEYLEVWEIWKD